LEETLRARRQNGLTVADPEVLDGGGGGGEYIGRAPKAQGQAPQVPKGERCGEEDTPPD